MSAQKVACIGDPGTHIIDGVPVITGQIVDSGQDGTVVVSGGEVTVAGGLFQCNQNGHGTTQMVHGQLLHGISPIISVITRSYVNGKLIVTEGAVAGCGAVMLPPSRGVFAG